MKLYLIEHEGCQWRLWYDRSLRLWTFYQIDNEGNQIGDTMYSVWKNDAENWIKLPYNEK